MSQDTPENIAALSAQDQQPVPESVEVQPPAPPADEVKDDRPVFVYPENQLKNATLEFEAVAGEDAFDPKLDPAKRGEVVSMPATTRDLTGEIAENFPETENLSTPEARRWNTILMSALENIIPVQKFGESVVNREKGDLRQYLSTERGRVGYSSPKFAEEGKKLSGDAAILRFRSLLGMGSIVSIPLWHSGFHITIRTPSESALIELRRRIVESKITLGRSTHGLIFSNQSSYTTQWIVDLILDHLHETSLKNRENIRQKIKTPDLPVLIWGLACCVWPKGFHYVRSLMTGEGINDKKVVEGKINVSKLMFVDNTAFTDFQKRHMANKTAGSVPDEALERYQQEFAGNAGRAIDLLDNGAIVLNLHIPSIDAYIASGQSWISSLIQIIDQTFTGENDEEEARNEKIIEHARATTLRQYSHWVNSITVEDSEITDREQIDAMLTSLSENDEMRKKYFDAIAKYIDDVTVAVIAIPETSGKPSGLPRFPRLIPIDPLSTFFTLIMQRTARIQTR